jgi:hypothetical protein
LDIAVRKQERLKGKKGVFLYKVWTISVSVLHSKREISQEEKPHIFLLLKSSFSHGIGISCSQKTVLRKFTASHFLIYPKTGK